MAPAPQVDRPIVIIGAPRSGTNMLRNVLTRLPATTTWPCDEINYIWRYGNARHSNDELQPGQATPKVRDYIRRCFAQIANRKGRQRVVEKTCANSLRVDYVNEILPDAMYVFLVRDGRDAVASAMKRWTAPLDVRYVIAKARHVPVADVPYYAARYLSHRIHRVFSCDSRLGSWGPRFEGMDDLLKVACLEQVCAVQWSRCVSLAHNGLAKLSSDQQTTLRYEDFVARPTDELHRLLAFLEVEATAEQVDYAVQHVVPSRVGKGSAAMNSKVQERIASVLNPQLKQCGYQAIETSEPTTDSVRVAA